MPGWLTATVMVGKWMLVCAGGVLLPTMLALGMYVLRKGTPSDADVQPTVRPFGPRGPTGQSNACTTRVLRS